MLSLQIQSVLYKNEKSSLSRAIESLKNALVVCGKEQGEFKNATVRYGDASPNPIFSAEEIQDLNEKYEGYIKIEYTFFDCNTGTAKGHNMLGKDCKTDYMMIMNPDILLSPTFFIEAMKPFYDRELNAGLVEARQTPIEHPKSYDTNTGETGWASTACVLFTTETFCQVDGFDEKNFFMYCDDVDFSWRIRLLGKKIIYQPLAPVFHAKSLSTKGGWQPTEAEIYYSVEADLMMAHKWSNPKLLKKLLLDFKSSDDKNFLKAAKSFELKKEQNTLPEPIDPKHKVATFVDGNYTSHRFLL